MNESIMKRAVEKGIIEVYIYKKLSPLRMMKNSHFPFLLTARVDTLRILK